MRKRCYNCKHYEKLDKSSGRCKKSKSSTGKEYFTHRSDPCVYPTTWFEEKRYIKPELWGEKKGEANG